MSRFSPSKNEGCFCCKDLTQMLPETPFITNPSNPSVLKDVKLSQYASMPLPQVPTPDSNALSSLLSNIDLNQSRELPTATVNTDSVQGSMSNNDEVLVKDATAEPLDQSTSFNFWDVHTRELGIKTKVIISHQDGKVFLSSSAPADSVPVQQNGPMNEADSMRTLTSGTCPSASMDLDSALDELGMLSTVTNSRQQYLLESHSKALSNKRDFRLRSKSESSPDLVSLSRPGGYHLLHLDPNYVTSVSHKPPVAASNQNFLFPNSTSSTPRPSHLDYRNPEALELQAAVRRRRSVPRMSRLRKNRYNYMRCPYKIPNRLCSSMQEPDYGPDYFENCPDPFGISPSPPAVATNLESLPGKPGHGPQSKSNTASPAKPSIDHHLVRSHSVEDLTSVQRKLELVLESQSQAGKETEESLDQVASQLNHLHMS